MEEIKEIYDSKEDTLKHKEEVTEILSYVINVLSHRSRNHDASKLVEPEKSIFDIYTPKLKICTYGSEEYKQNLKEMKVALDHHYSNNMHHPDFYKKYVCNHCHNKYSVDKDFNKVCICCLRSDFTIEPDISQMTLIDLIEMIADWAAATKRHDDGDIFRSIEVNQKRFKYGEELKSILTNTARKLL